MVYFEDVKHSLGAKHVEQDIVEDKLSATSITIFIHFKVK